MDEKKHIDRIFQEKLKHFEATPDDAVWENIYHRLHKDKRKRRVVPLWWKVAGVAAVLALLLTFGSKLITSPDTTNMDGNGVDVVDTDNKKNSDANNGKDNDNTLTNHPDNDNSQKIVDTNNPSGQDSQNTQTDAQSPNNSTTIVGANDPTINNGLANHEKANGNNSIITTDNRQEKQNDIALTTTTMTNNENVNVDGSEQDPNNASKDKKFLQNQYPSAESDKLINDAKNPNNTAITDASEKLDETLNEDIKEDLTIEEAIAEVEANNLDEEKEKTFNRWNISPNVAPIYFNSLGKGSSLDEQFVNNSKEGDVTMSYGVGGSYAINDRLKIRAGINKVDMGYTTNNIIAFSSIDSTSMARSHISNLDANANGQNMAYLSGENINKTTSPEIMNATATSAISQKLGFIEVPVEIEYALMDKKLAINVIGGFSTLIVDRNDVYSVVDGQEIRIGEANNINSMSYSANFGLGINYNISEKVKLNVEPTFKYQINTFNNSSGNFQPYFIGVYTGFSYKF